MTDLWCFAQGYVLTVTWGLVFIVTLGALWPWARRERVRDWA